MQSLTEFDTILRFTLKTKQKMNTKIVKTFSFLVALLTFGSNVLAAPQDVKNLKATAIDANSIGLTWDAAKDENGGLVDKYRIYYGSLSVFKAGAGSYENEIDTTNNNTSYVIRNLDPETEYFFSITALDADETESEQYAQEASATTPAAEKQEGETDSEGPIVSSVSAIDMETVKVVFNEAVELPTENPESAFTISVLTDSSKLLEIKSANLDSTDSEGKTITLKTALQETNINYSVTAGITIKDKAGNPIVSGVTDSGLFLGSEVEVKTDTQENKEEDQSTEEENKEEDLSIDDLISDINTLPEGATQDCKEDFSCFAEKLNDCSLAQVIEKDDQFEYKLEITGSESGNCVVKYTAEKHPNILFAGSNMECKITKGNYENKTKYRESFQITECAGDLVTGYKATELADTTPPENVTNLLLSFAEKLDKYMVTLKWTASENSAQDLVDQLLYTSLDRGSTYDQGKSLGASATETNVDNLEGGKEYTFKVTTKDAAGNESTGAIKSIRLPQTGMGIGLMLGLSAFAAHKGLRRKRKDHHLI